ncbi:hypothetical protein QJS66_13720 [Kocuria rhizophila]|nr:hypothetical protein QJS66_13720 [Kocuria rhizophila]
MGSGLAGLAAAVFLAPGRRRPGART